MFTQTLLAWLFVVPRQVREREVRDTGAKQGAWNTEVHNQGTIQVGELAVLSKAML